MILHERQDLGPGKTGGKWGFVNVLRGEKYMVEGWLHLLGDEEET